MQISAKFFSAPLLKILLRNLFPRRVGFQRRLPSYPLNNQRSEDPVNSLYLDFPLLGEIDSLQRAVDQMLGSTSSLRAERRGSFPALNIGSSEKSVEILAFLPGVDPSSLEVTTDKGVLALSGERQTPQINEGAKRYAQERFSGTFRRTVELPQNVDSSKVTARYRNGCLRITVAKEEPSAPKTISVQRGE
jgi:HSP20 family protein